MGHKLVHEVCQQIMSKLPKQSRFIDDNKVCCNLWVPNTHQYFKLYKHQGNYYLSNLDGSNLRVFGLQLPEDNEEQLIASLQKCVALPQVNLCFGYKEKGKITGFWYLSSAKISDGGAEWFVAPGSSLCKAWPVAKRHSPDFSKFWKLVAKGALVDITDKVHCGTYVDKHNEGMVVYLGLEGVYFADIKSPEPVKRNPEDWFHANRLVRQRFELSDVLKTRGL